MNPEFWRKAEELLHEVLERAPETRQAFLEEVCAMMPICGGKSNCLWRKMRKPRESGGTRFQIHFPKTPFRLRPTPHSFNKKYIGPVRGSKYRVEKWKTYTPEGYQLTLPMLIGLQALAVLPTM